MKFKYSFNSCRFLHPSYQVQVKIIPKHQNFQLSQYETRIQIKFVNQYISFTASDLNYILERAHSLKFFHF